MGLWAAHCYVRRARRRHFTTDVVTGVGPVEGRLAMIIANDATVKAGDSSP
ncbi:MAG: carboxyl transferase domain-containing protein [Phycisphaerales bacterium]